MVRIHAGQASFFKGFTAFVPLVAKRRDLGQVDRSLFRRPQRQNISCRIKLQFAN